MSIFIDPTGSSSFGIGICARCSRKMRLEDLYSDPNAPGLMVCIDDLDEFDPYRLAARPTEEINLLYVRPDRPLSDVLNPDPTFSLLYQRAIGDGQLRATESGEFREIEEAPDGGTPPWEL